MYVSMRRAQRWLSSAEAGHGGLRDTGSIEFRGNCSTLTTAVPGSTHTSPGFTVIVRLREPCSFAVGLGWADFEVVLFLLFPPVVPYSP